MGEFYSLLAALFWAGSVILFKGVGESVGPVALNLAKNCIALVLFLLTALLLTGGWPHVRETKDLWLLLISGVLGIGISDTLFLFALNQLGASRTALVDSMYSPFVILVSFSYLDERLRFLDAVGAALIVSSVLLSARGDFG